MNVINTLRDFVLGSTNATPTVKMFPANPDRKPHTMTSHPTPCGVHRTKNSKAIGHGPDNVGEHPIYRGYHIPRSKYQPRIDTPKALRA